MAQSDLRLAGDVEPRNETARRRGGPHVRQSRGGDRLASSSSPKTCPLVKPEMAISGDGGALPTCVPPLRRASSPKGTACPFAIRWPPRLTAHARSPG